MQEAVERIKQQIDADLAPMLKTKQNRAAKAKKKIKDGGAQQNNVEKDDDEPNELVVNHLMELDYRVIPQENRQEETIDRKVKRNKQFKKQRGVMSHNPFVYMSDSKDPKHF